MVSLVDTFEDLFCFTVPGIVVGMVFHGKLLVGHPDLGGSSGLLNTQDFVIICHKPPFLPTLIKRNFNARLFPGNSIFFQKGLRTPARA
jgi:hypothetical protein